MRVVVDTNVFVSAALKNTSNPALALRSAARRGTLLKSDATQQQLVDVLARPYLEKLIAPISRDWALHLLAAAENVEIVQRIEACRDPTDDKFLDVAINGHADLIVSGDNDLYYWPLIRFEASGSLRRRPSRPSWTWHSLTVS